MIEEKLVSMGDAIGRIANGSRVALGGSFIRRHPMAAVQEIVRQQKRDLVLYGWNNSIDFDLLIGCGCVREAHSAYVGLGNAGQARNFQRAVETGTIRFVDHSETTAIDRFRAGASGLPFIPSKSPLNTALRANKEYQTDIRCPFTGESYIAMEAFSPDVAIVHAHRADRFGNVQLDPRRMMDNETDVLIAKSARFVIVTVEQIVSEETISENPMLTVLPRLFVDVVVEVPYGAHPTSCDTRYDYDLEHLTEYSHASDTSEGFKSYVEQYVAGTNSFSEYLDLVGFHRIRKITRRHGGLMHE